MKICAIQYRSIKSDIVANIDRQTQYAKMAAAEGADLVIFPELSLTGYEPALSGELASTLADGRYAPLKQLSEEKQLVIVTGMPLQQTGGITISLLVFQPAKPVTVYHKKYLHTDEEPWFVSHPSEGVLSINEEKVGLAICYEVFVPAHREAAAAAGATVYSCSVAKSAGGMERAMQTLSQGSAHYHTPAVLANSIGPSDNFIAAGGSAAWNNKGELLVQLDNEREGWVLLDTYLQVARSGYFE